MLTLALSIAFLVLTYWVLARRRRSKLLPPGPPREPLIGNVRHLKILYPWLYFSELAEKYGDVVCVEVLGHPIVILSSIKAIEDLVVKKSAIFSGRPVLPMAGDLVGFARTIVLIDPGPRFQMSRKLMHQFMGPQAIPQYHSAIETQTRTLVNHMFTDSTDFFESFVFTVGSMMIDLTYGIKVDSPEDPYVRNAVNVVKAFSVAAQPGRFLVDTLPVLKYVPSWFPFAGFKRLAAELRHQLDCHIDLPLEQVKDEMSKGVAKSSFASQMLEDLPPGVTEDVIKYTCSSLYGGAVDTTAAAIGIFVLNMVLHPEIQQKAQAELDRVVGSERLPSIAEYVFPAKMKVSPSVSRIYHCLCLSRKDLPYLEAVLKEVMRWYPIAPTAIPYKTLQDCQYRGWVIPKDATIIANCWALSRDPEIYPEHEVFNPERFMDDPHLLDPRQFFFGFGRRICPGQHLADPIVWTTMATLLATSRILKKVDDNGLEITPNPEFTGEQPSRAKPFPFRIEPRSKAAVTMIQDATPYRG